MAGLPRAWLMRLTAWHLPLSRRIGKTMSGIFISVVVPTYNRAQLVLAALDSVLSQTYTNLEIVVVDDGSTDETRTLVQRLVERKAGPRVRYFYQSNQGQSIARNKGISEAAGNWIAFLDSDDVWFTEKLQLQAQAITKYQESCGACFTDARLVDRGSLNTTAFRHAGWQFGEATGVVPDIVRPLATTFGGVWVQTLIARTDLVRKIGGFDPELHFAEDHDLLFRLSLETPYCYVKQPLAVIERTNTLIDPAVALRNWDKLDFRLQAQQYMYEKWLNLDAKYPADIRQIVVGNLRAVHSGWANWYLETGQYGQARHEVAKAMKYEVTPQLMAKWALTRIAPTVARRIARRAIPG